jgi:hypothetical protein
MTRYSGPVAGGSNNVRVMQKAVTPAKAGVQRLNIIGKTGFQLSPELQLITCQAFCKSCMY